MPRNTETTATIYKPIELKHGEERELDICFRYYAGCKATRWHPGDPPEVEITEITDHHTHEEIPEEQIPADAWPSIIEEAEMKGDDALNP